MTEEIRKAFEAEHPNMLDDLVFNLDSYSAGENGSKAMAAIANDTWLGFRRGFAHQQKRIDELETLLNNLAIATNNYRNYHDLYGRGDLRTGRAWDEMARYERKAIYGLEEQNND